VSNEDNLGQRKATGWAKQLQDERTRIEDILGQMPIGKVDIDRPRCEMIPGVLPTREGRTMNTAPARTTDGERTTNALYSVDGHFRIVPCCLLTRPYLPIVFIACTRLPDIPSIPISDGVISWTPIKARSRATEKRPLSERIASARLCCIIRFRSL
jgi:hypothetical protein